MSERDKQHRAREERERAEREERKQAYAKKKNEDGFGTGWSARQKKIRTFDDWDSFDADAEMERIEDEDRRSRGLNDVEIRNEKILEIMQNHDLSEKEKMETCMGIAGHKNYKHELTEE